MSRGIFVSYHFKEDAHIAKNIGVFFQKAGGKCNGNPTYVVKDVGSQGDDAIDREIRDVMDRCDAIIVVVGNSTHNRRWIDREAQLAKSKAIPILAVQAPNTTGGIPNELKENDIPLVKWDHDEICNTLNRLFS